MTRRQIIGALLLGVLPGGREAAAANGKPQSGDLVLLKRRGIVAYEEVAEGFMENCRVRVRQVQIEDGLYPLGDAQQRVGAPPVVVAVGQAAVDVAAGTPAQIIYAMAPDAPASAIGADYEPPLDLLFRALLEIRPGSRRIGAVASRRRGGRLAKGRIAARALGLEMIERVAENGPQAVRALHELSTLSAGKQRGLDAIWLGADPQIVTTPVFQYALQLQLKSGVPVLAATRQQVRSGALLAVDWAPRMIGRRLAALVNLSLEGVPRPELTPREDPAGLPQVTLNRMIAGKLGVDLTGRRLSGWRLE